MELDKSIRAAVKLAVEQHPGSPDDATDAAMEAVTELEEYENWIHSLVLFAVRDLVYEARCLANRHAKANAGGERRVKREDSEESASVQNSLYAYYIGGRVLGNLKGEDLPAIAESERSVAYGHTVNAKLIESLIPLVADGKTVEEAVKPAKLQKLFEAAQRNAA